ncbi:MAG: hypothetical protein ACE5E9_13600 [Nitrospinaceae bacterium]
MELSEIFQSVPIWAISLEILLLLVLIFFIPLFLYLDKKYTKLCFRELRRQNHILEIQTRSVDELNRWMSYFNDRIIKREKVQPPDKQDQSADPPDSASPYKKTI